MVFHNIMDFVIDVIACQVIDDEMNMLSWPSLIKILPLEDFLS